MDAAIFTRMKLKWRNLLKNECPRCGCKVFYKKDSELFECALFEENPRGTFSCDFAISERKMQDLKNKILTGKILNEYNHDNFESWNNYGVNS